MKSKILIGGVSFVVAVFVLYVAVCTLLSIPSFLNPFYEKCLDVSQGMDREEVVKQMQEFLNDPKYTTEEKSLGTYGWKGRLTYDSSLLITRQDEPWYKLDQHPWRCDVFFKDGLVVNVEPFFD
jgi:hypothetical protein